MWTQFEEFPRFMDGVESVRQLDDKRLHWRVNIGGKVKEWDAVFFFFFFGHFPRGGVASRSRNATVRRRN